MNQQIIILSACILLFASCSSSIDNISLLSIDGNEISLMCQSEKKGTVFFFLSPECPLCENYSVAINKFFHDYESDSFLFYGVFPGTFYKKNRIKSYLIKYDIAVPVLLDPEMKLTHALKASITPEVVVMNNDCKILYQGAIDNWAIDLGKKRVMTTKHYLEDALNAIQANQQILVPKTKAVGCFIE